eukprot:m.103325 g.103325  ORF g.103325 m.103325 type:complete len:224 (+) comp20871_c0_seq1:335-1006(+)
MHLHRTTVVHVGQPTRLPFPTPTGWQGWAPLQGTTVLVGSDASVWVFDRPYFHKGTPVYVNRHFGRAFRVYREGEWWFWSTGSLPVYRIQHATASDPNLPPNGRGWVRCDNNTATDLSFSLSPNLEISLRQQPWRFQKHRTFPPIVRAWIINVVLCNRRLCANDGGQPTATSTTAIVQANIRPPPLPLEMWIAVLSFLAIGDMMAALDTDRQRTLPAASLCLR